jgi:SNF2 family DNA or RNA helicase
MALIALQKEMGSCSLAAAPTLERLAAGSETPKAALRLRDLAAQARRQVDSAKAARLVQLLRDFPDKMVIFTQFQATQDYLAGVLTEVGEPPALFNGRLPRLAKEAAVAAFRGGTRLLLATDSGSEGRNLQFCHAICNFDLPWNPMRIEQRVGRLSRIGQSEDVYVFNLVSAGTLEADLLYLLEAKVNLFEMVMGEMDMVLGNLDEEREFEDLVLDLWAASEDETDFHGRLERLGDELAAAKEAYLRQRELDERLFGDSLVPEG